MNRIGYFVESEPKFRTKDTTWIKDKSLTDLDNFLEPDILDIKDFQK